MTLPSASTPWTWNTDFAISRPIVVTACMVGSSESWSPHRDHFLGAYAPVEEPSTASKADIHKLKTPAHQPGLCSLRSHGQTPASALRRLRRHQPNRPPLANIRPGRPAPAIGPGTGV